MRISKNYSKLLETDRLLLRATDYTDADFVIKLTHTPAYIQHIGSRNVNSLSDAKRYIRQKVYRQYCKLGFGNFTVECKHTGEKMGTCGIYYRNVKDLFDLGFAFLPEFEGKGYAFEAASAVIEFGRRELGMKEFRALCTSENTRSQNLLRRLGFTFSKMDKLPFESEELMLFELK